MKHNKGAGAQVAKNASKNIQKIKNIKKNKEKFQKNPKLNSIKPQIKKAVQKELGTAINNSQLKAKAKKNNQKQPKNVQDPGKTKVSKSETLSEEDIAKLEKRKAKKLQQKLKKAKAREIKDKAKPSKTKGVEVDKVEETVPILATNNEAPLANSPKKVQNKLKKKLEKPKKVENEAGENVKRNPVVAAATVFVGNLPINTKRVQIGRLFKDYGKVVSIRLRTASGKNIFKHKMRKEAGSLIAFVQLTSIEAAKNALALNGVQFKGNHLRVTPSDQKGTLQTDGESKFDAKRTIFVGSLKYSATEEKLREVFSSCGEIDYIRCLQDGEKGCKGVAYVCFKSPDAVGLALELNETVLDDRPIHVERYAVKKLGAKQKRDAETEANNPKKKGAFKRIQNKSKGQKASDEGDVNQKKKKGEFRGVKMDSLKKKNKNKKKSNDQMKKMAAKIAPIIKASKGE